MWIATYVMYLRQIQGLDEPGAGRFAVTRSGCLTGPIRGQITRQFTGMGATSQVLPGETPTMAAGKREEPSGRGFARMNPPDPAPEEPP